jgi:filamentous hemagglutinin
MGKKAIQTSPHPESDLLFTAIDRCLVHAIPWRGELFRFTDMTWANLHDLATGRGAFLAGGRWNPKNGFAALYLSTRPETALAEALAQRRYQNVPDSEATPLVLTAFQVVLQQILDLTAVHIRNILQVTAEQLKAPWRRTQNQGREALTQAIGRLTREAGFEGLLVPSAPLSGGTNLITFPKRELIGSSVEVVNPERFPMIRRRLGRRKQT